MEWAAGGIGSYKGFWLLGSGKINKFICRGNVFRREDGTLGNDDGIEVQCDTEATIENNIIDVAMGESNVKIRHDALGKFTAFNNRRSDGTLLRSLNSSTQLYDPELTTQVAENLAMY